MELNFILIRSIRKKGDKLQGCWAQGSIIIFMVNIDQLAHAIQYIQSSIISLITVDMQL
jgi:hypothetical protein